MTQALAIAAGGALGALLRYWASTGVHAWLGRGFPYGTLFVNVLGSLLMGFLYIWLLERMAVSPVVRAFLLIGVLGAFTTFSAFVAEADALAGTAGPVYAASSVVAGLAAARLGMGAAR